MIRGCVQPQSTSPKFLRGRIRPFFVGETVISGNEWSSSVSLCRNCKCPSHSEYCLYHRVHQHAERRGPYYRVDLLQGVFVRVRLPCDVYDALFEGPCGFEAITFARNGAPSLEGEGRRKMRGSPINWLFFGPNVSFRSRLFVDHVMLLYYFVIQRVTAVFHNSVVRSSYVAQSAKHDAQPELGWDMG